MPRPGGAGPGFARYRWIQDLPLAQKGVPSIAGQSSYPYGHERRTTRRARPGSGCGRLSDQGLWHRPHLRGHATAPGERGAGVIESGLLELSNKEFEFIQSLLIQESGLYFDREHQRVLPTALSERMKLHGFESVEEYYHFLRFHPESRSELRLLIESLTI